MDGERGGHVRIFQWLKAECALRAGLDDTISPGHYQYPRSCCET